MSCKSKHHPELWTDVKYIHLWKSQITMKTNYSFLFFLFYVTYIMLLKIMSRLCFLLRIWQAFQST